MTLPISRGSEDGSSLSASSEITGGNKSVDCIKNREKTREIREIPEKSPQHVVTVTLWGIKERYTRVK